MLPEDPCQILYFLQFLRGDLSLTDFLRIRHLARKSVVPKNLELARMTIYSTFSSTSTNLRISETIKGKGIQQVSEIPSPRLVWILDTLNKYGFQTVQFSNTLKHFIKSRTYKLVKGRGRLAQGESIRFLRGFETRRTLKIFFQAR